MSLLGDRRWTLLHGNNSDVFPTLADRSVAHVITDPPYESEAHTLGRRLKGDTINGVRGVDEAPLSFASISPVERDEAAKQFARIASRWVVVFCQVEAAMTWQNALVSHGAKAKRIGVWVKPDGMPQYSGDRPGMGYESIVFCHAAHEGKSRWNGGGRVGVFTFNKGEQRGKNDHETQKPVALMVELIKLFTDPDEIVFDPYAGSGTTGIACLQLGRRFIGVEKDAKYAQLAFDRLTAFDRGLDVREARGGQNSLFDGSK